MNPEYQMQISGKIEKQKRRLNQAGEYFLFIIIIIFLLFAHSGCRFVVFFFSL